MPVTMLEFYACLHARPTEVEIGPSRPLGKLKLPTLAINPAELPAFNKSFEETAAALKLLPRMFCEEDGSFVWVSSAGEPAWQVDGNLYDRAGKLLFVDLKGRCPSEQFDRLLSACDWPVTRVVLQLVREAVFVEEEVFRRYASDVGYKRS